MNIETKFATLRAIEEKDFDLLFNMMNDPEIESLTGGWSLPISSTNQREWMSSYKNSNKEIRVIIELKNGTTIGMLALTNIDWKNRTAIIHTKINNSQEGRIKGDTIDAMQGFLRYAFLELGLNCITGAVLIEHTFSRKMTKKLGFKEEGLLRQRIYKDGIFHDQIPLSILRDEFIALMEK
jgi:RimJ/RimL family protein N-acetyltransferase